MTPPRDGRRDFDFLVGTFDVRHRRLRERLTGCTDWDEFDGTLVARSILGGLGNMDEGVINRPGGTTYGATFRLYDVETGLWSLYWAAGTSGTLDVPTVGSFTDGRGTFHCAETIGTDHVFTRYVWRDITATGCRWEQALSPDGGATWETNWTMDFTRTG